LQADLPALVPGVPPARALAARGLTVAFLTQAGLRTATPDDAVAAYRAAGLDAAGARALGLPGPMELQGHLRGVKGGPPFQMFGKGKRAVLVFPGADLTEAEHIAFSRRFGALERTLSQRTERQEISLLSNVAKDGAIAKPDDALGLFLAGNRAWHTDSSFKKVGAKASLLRAVETPATGGDTEWADMRAAWDVLAPAMQARLDKLVAEHSYAWSQGQIGGTALLSERELEALPPVRHPLVRTHPATGRKNLSFVEAQLFRRIVENFVSAQLGFFHEAERRVLIRNHCLHRISLKRDT